MDNNNESQLQDDIKYLEKKFKKWTPNMLSSPYIPTPSILLKSQEDEYTNNNGNGNGNGKGNGNNSVIKEIKVDQKPVTNPNIHLSKKDYEEIISCLHKGAVAYSSGDYGTAINYFTRLLETDWLRYSSYFYLVKTLIKLDIEKEILSMQSKGQVNNIRMKKDRDTTDTANN
jgi:hypothetical protein